MKQSDGIRMEPQETWKLFGASDLYAFVRHLDMLFPEDAVLCLEGIMIAPDIRVYVSEREPTSKAVVARGTEWAMVFPNSGDGQEVESVLLHMLLTHENLDGLYTLMGHLAELEIADHMYVYRSGIMLMEGHDWNYGTFYVTGEVPKEKIKAFCETVGCRYERSFDYGPIEE